MFRANADFGEVVLTNHSILSTEIVSFVPREV